MLEVAEIEFSLALVADLPQRPVGKKELGDDKEVSVE
jgi:hypothetical protein